MDSGHARRQPRFVYLTDRPEGTARARFGWQLTAANHRPLGRSAAVMRTLDACRGAASDVRSSAGVDTVNVVPALGRWRWELVLSGRVAARSIHRYARRIECERALGQFLAALAVAEPAAGVVRHYGPRALRVFGEVAADAGVPS